MKTETFNDLALSPAHAALDIASRTYTAMQTMRHFIGGAQLKCVREMLRGEEAEYFCATLERLAAVVKAMPGNYEQDGAGDAAVVHLHYFAGGRANWYITEKDKGGPDDGQPGEPARGEQNQAFGLADLFGDGGELGYISIKEIIEAGGELDFHWKPKTLAEIQKKGNDDETE